MNRLLHILVLVSLTFSFLESAVTTSTLSECLDYQNKDSAYWTYTTLYSGGAYDRFPDAITIPTAGWLCLYNKAVYMSPYDCVYNPAHSPAEWQCKADRDYHEYTTCVSPNIIVNGVCEAPKTCMPPEVLSTQTNTCITPTCSTGLISIEGTCLSKNLSDSIGTNQGKSDEKKTANKTCNVQTASHIKPKERTFHEDISIAGTNLKLWYDSSRASGYNHKVQVPYTGNTLSDNLSSIKVTMQVADRSLEQLFDAPSANAEASFIWDGKDSTGVEQEGIVNAKVTIAYNYALLNGGTHTTYKRSTVKLHRRSPKPELADSWMLSAQTHLSAKNFLQTASGDGERMGYDQPLFTSEVNTESWKAITKDGSDIYYILGNQVYKLNADASSTLIAGNGTQGTTGDGSAATSAQLENPLALAVDSNHLLYIISANHIRAIDASGKISTPITGSFTTVGTASMHGTTLYLADEAHLYSWEVGGTLNTLHERTNIKGLANDQDGNLYISASHTILKRDSYGNLNTIAGSDTAGYEGDYFLALDAQLNTPTLLSMDEDNNLYLYDSANARIRRIDNKGIITTIAGGGLNPLGESINTSVDTLDVLLITANDELYLSSTTGTTKIAHNALTQPYLATDLLKIDATLAYQYDAEGYILNTLDPKGLVLQTFAYDANKKLISITDRFNQVITIERDGNGKATAVIAPHGERTSLTHDARGYLGTLSYDDGSAYSFEYLDNGLMTTMIDPNGNHFSHLYDAEGRISEVSDEEGGQWSFARSSINGAVDSSVSMALGSLKTFADSETETSNDMLSTSADGTQTEVSTHKDAKSRTISSCGVTTETSYVLDAYSKQKRTNSTSTTLPSGLSQTTSINKSYATTDGVTLSSITSTVTTNAKTSTTVDEASQTTITSPEGRTVTLTKNPTTLLVSTVQTPNLNPVTYEYNTEGQVTRTTTGTRVTSTSYNTKGNVATQTDPNGEVTYYYYDGLNRLTQIQHPSANSTYFTYDAAGNMKRLTTPTPAAFESNYNKINFKSSERSPLGNETRYTYDAERHLTSIVRPSAQTINYSYTNGLMTSMSRPEGVSSYNYTCDGKLQQVVSANGESINYTYDGNLLETMSYNGELSQLISYSYNNDFFASSISYAGSTQALNYDNDGLLTQSGNFNITRDTQNGLPMSVSDNTFTQDRSFNAYGEIDQEINTVDANSIFTYEITERYANGQIKTKTETLKGVTNTYAYTYDNMNRLSAVKINNKLSESYEYDTNGNRTRKLTVEKGGKGKDGTKGWTRTSIDTSYTIEDQIERVGGFTYTYNTDGYLSSKTDGTDTTTYVYGSLGELKAVTLPNGDLVEYRHNANNQRVAKVKNGVVVEKYLWKDLTTLLATYNADNTLAVRYNYADNRVPYSMAYAGATYYLAYDQVGTLKAVTDSVGNVVKELSYDSFGNILSDSNPSMSLPFAFAGGLYDSDTGLTRFGYRDYDSVTGKWTAKDPIGFDGGDTSLYGYVLGDPVNFVDPNGLLVDKKCWIKKIKTFVDFMNDSNDATKRRQPEGTDSCDTDPITGDPYGMGTAVNSTSDFFKTKNALGDLFDGLKECWSLKPKRPQLKQKLKTKGINFDKTI